jgi:outer membrane immunogenic protein
MKKILLGMGVGLFLAAPALAADMPVKAGPAPAAPAFTWTGYNGGWAQQDFDWAFNPALAAPNQAYSLSRSGWTIGLHSGYQRQFGQFVLGWESGYMWFGRDWAERPGFGVGTATSQARINYVMTTGPRLGWSPIARGLLFVSGGFALGSIDTRGDTPTGPVAGAHARHYGWYLGGGGEYALTNQVILGIEYQHIDLDTKRHCVDAPVCGANFNNRDINATVDIVRGRLTFKSLP